MPGYRTFTAFWLGGAGDLVATPPPPPPVRPRCNGRWSTEIVEMPAAIFPFERIMVDHLFRGTTRVWWRLDPLLNIEPPHLFKLEASYVGTPSALDWVPLTEELNATHLTYDTTRELTGKNLLTHFRVVLVAGGQTFRSNAMPIWGTLSQGNWSIAREIIRKHELHQKTTAIDGYALRRMRYGVDDPGSTDPLTGAQLSSFRKTSWGTPFKVGYHPPFDFKIEITPRTSRETKGGADPQEYSAKQDTMQVTALAMPQLIPNDVWVNKVTDERWIVGEDIEHISSLQGVPLIVRFTLQLLPHNDIVYQIPVDEWSIDPTDLEDGTLPTVGTGCILVDHDYPTNENMTYTSDDCCAIEGATVSVFTAEDWDNGARLPQNAVATSITTTGGRWAYAVRLNPGDYIVQFHLDGRYGPDTVPLTVELPQESSVSVAESSEVSIDDHYGMF